MIIGHLLKQGKHFHLQLCFVYHEELPPKIFSKEKCHTSYLQLKERLSVKMKKQQPWLKKAISKLWFFCFLIFFFDYLKNRDLKQKNIYIKLT